MKGLSLLLMLLTLAGCNPKSEIASLNTINDTQKVWVFAQFNVPEEQDAIDSYYYYAHISHAMYDLIKRNELDQGFILLENVKYWGDDDLIHQYKDIERAGEMILRVENITKIDLINIEPITGKGIEQFEDDIPSKEELPAQPLVESVTDTST
jgi:hypothetical protein